jgi:hypothetical protein
MRHASERRLMRFDCRLTNQNVGTSVIDFILDHDLVFRLMQLDHLAELGGLGGWVPQE